MVNMSTTDRAIFFRSFAGNAPIKSEKLLQERLLSAQVRCSRASKTPTAPPLLGDCCYHHACLAWAALRQQGCIAVQGTWERVVVMSHSGHDFLVYRKPFEAELIQLAKQVRALLLTYCCCMSAGAACSLSADLAGPAACASAYATHGF